MSSPYAEAIVAKAESCFIKPFQRYVFTQKELLELIEAVTIHATYKALEQVNGSNE